MNKEKLAEKIGEALGLEMAAQKAVKDLSSKDRIKFLWYQKVC